MIFITDELGKFEKNIIELAENVGFKECKTIEAIDLFCGISERNDVLKEMVNNMIILAFDNTAHSKELYPMGNIFESSNYVKMKETLKNIITSQTIFNEYIDRQKKQLKQLAAKVVMGDTDESI